MNPGGSISTLLERELQDEIRQRGVVVWLDAGAAYNEFVDGLADRAARGEFCAPVVRFRGSYLDTLLQLDGKTDGLDAEPLLIHLPGHAEDLVRQTPLLEVYRAGFRHRVALATLVRKAAHGLVPPEACEEFLRTTEASGDLTLQRAEEWLAGATQGGSDKFRGLLDHLGAEMILDGLLSRTPEFRGYLGSPDNLDTLCHWLHRHVGLDRPFLDFFLGRDPLTAQSAGEALLGWLLCVEYVHDLAREPHLEMLAPLRRLPDPARRACLSLVQHARHRHPVEYEQAADQTEALLEADLARMSAHDLGRIDTFRREDTTVLEAAVEALVAGRWQEAHDWAEQRPPTSFWQQRDASRRMAWQLVHHAAALGRAIEHDPGLQRGTGTGATPDNLRIALERYTESASRVDRAHRHYEQARLKMLDQRLPHFARLLEATERLRRDWRRWADALSLEFNSLCTRRGFLPDPELQQRNLYEQVVHPLLRRDDARVACFLVDAFRYEMGLDLRDAIEEPGVRIHLGARYAELPTVTAVGMNALAPVAREGRMQLVGDGTITGLATRTFQVRTPDDRARAMGERSLDAAAGAKRWRSARLGEICDTHPDTLRDRLRSHRLVIVHSQEIDDAGEANVGLASFETWIAQLRSAYLHLKAAGFTSFVVTADHGFLLQDSQMREQPYGTVRDAKRRYVLSAERRAETGLVAASLTELGYEGRDGREGWFLFPEDTAVFATGTPGATFVHGGNSLQERVIPVLQVTVQRKSAGLKETYRIEAEALPEVLGHARMRVRATSTEPLLGNILPPLIEVALRAPEAPDIRIQVKEVHGGGRLANQMLGLQVDGEWAEVLFALEGPSEERTYVEVHHPAALHDVDAVLVKTYFAVKRISTSPGTAAEPPTEGRTGLDWRDNFDDGAVRDVFTHLHEHGSLTETELVGKLGSPRKARQFALAFDRYLDLVPFTVRVENNASGKRYVRGS